MAYPVLPLFLTGILQAPASALGAIEGLAEATVSFMKGWSGRHSDKAGKRVPYVQWGYGISSIAKPMIGLAMGWPLVLFARVLDRVGKGIRTTARDAMIADSVEPDQYGKAFGFHRALDTAGAFAGVGVALLLLQLMPENYRFVLLAAVVPGILSVFLTLRLREPESITPSNEEIMEKPVGQTCWIDTIRKLDLKYWRAAVLALIFGIANTSDMFLMVQAKSTGLSDTGVIAAYMLFNLVVVLTSTRLGMLSDRFGRWNLLFIGWLLYGGVYLWFGTASQAMIWPLFAGYGLYYGFSQGVGRALVADHSPKEFRGTAIGLFFMLSGFATLIGNLIMGRIWDVSSPKMAFQIMGCIAIIAALLIPLTSRIGSRTRPHLLS
jgi:MFS family permease